MPARLLVVTGTDAIALAASYALVKAARERTAAMPGGPVACAVLVNRHDDESASIGFAQIASACETFLGCSPTLAGALPDDASLDLALRAGMPLQDAAAGSPAAVAAQALVERLLAELAHDRKTDRRSDSPNDRTARRTTSPYAPPPFRSTAAPAGAPR